MEQKETFDSVASLYDAVRPSYPSALIDASISEARLPTSARLLEVGVGTGQATLPFAARNYSIVGLEPGGQLAAVAAENMKAYPNVSIATISFEEWPLHEAHYDLVFSATAFHWVDPRIRYEKAAQSLNDKGHIALFWNMPPDPEEPIEREINAVYKRIVPEMAHDYLHQPLATRMKGIEDEITNSGLFDHLSVRQFPWRERYDTERYLRLLNTYSNHRLLPEAKRSALFAGIADVFTRHDGSYLKPYVAVLYLARKKADCQKLPGRCALMPSRHKA